MKKKLPHGRSQAVAEECPPQHPNHYCSPGINPACIIVLRMKADYADMAASHTRCIVTTDLQMWPNVTI
jgi:hypothetical protein